MSGHGTASISPSRGQIGLHIQSMLRTGTWSVSVRGPAVADLEHAFASTWAEASKPLPDEERPRVEPIAAAGDEAVRVIIQEPRRMRALRMLQLPTAGVERRLWITDAYFI